MQDVDQGHHSVYLSQLGFNVIGIDLSEAALKIAESIKTKRTEFFNRNMVNTQYRPNSINGIWCCASVVHMPRTLIPRLLREFNGILTAGWNFRIDFRHWRKAAF